MRPIECITTARLILNDTDSTAYRNSDAELLDYFNQGMAAAVPLSPKTFQTTGNYSCVDGQTEQSLSYNDAYRIESVIRIKDGSAVTEMDMQMMNRFHPEWASDPAGPAKNWAKNPNEQLRFYIYPKAPEMQVLEVIYIKNPATYGMNDDVVEAPSSWKSALTDYIVFRAESKDDEHVNSQRAVAHYNSFVQQITGTTAQTG